MKCKCECHRILPGMDPEEKTLFDGCDECIETHVQHHRAETVGEDPLRALAMFLGRR